VRLPRAPSARADAPTPYAPRPAHTLASLVLQSIRKVWINTVRTCHGQALAFVCQALEALLPQFGTLPFRDHEAFLFLLHAFGEGCAGRLQQLLAAGSPFRDALIALHTAMLPMFDRLHEMVLLQFVELVVRYAKVLPSSAQVQGVLQALCGPNGIGHASATVRSQCAYYLLKLCQKLVSAIRPFTGAVVAAIKEQLAVANADPKAPRLSPLDQLNLLEVAGLLVGKLGDDDAMARFCGEVVSGQLAALQQAMGAAHMEPDGDTQGPVSQALARSIESVAQFSKGFKAVVAVQPEFAKFLDATARLLTEHPRFYLVRKKSVFLLQRMAVILGEGILPFVPVVIAPLLANSRDADELREAIRWLNMLIIKFKARMGPVVEAIFLALIGRIFALMPSAVHDVAGSGSTFALTERLQLQKIYFSFIDHMVKHQCAHVLFADCNVAQLEQFLGTIRHGCIAADGFAPDLTVHKACFDIVRQLVLIWLAPSETPPPPVAVRSLFAEFAVQRVTDAMFRCATLPHFDLEDAEANAVMSSIAALQGAMVQALGAAFLQYVHDVYLPSINCPPNLARDFAAQLQASATDKAKLHRNFRDFVAAMQQKQ
jgi:exportin-T